GRPQPVRPIFPLTDTVVPKAHSATNNHTPLLHPLPKIGGSMAPSRRAGRLLFLPLALVHLLSSCPHTTSGAPNTAPLSVLCNGAVYGAGDPFAESLAYVLADLLAATPQSRARDAYTISPYPNAFAYGHAACRAGLTGVDCASCLGSAVSQMNATCGHAVGARAVLVDCSVRYEQYAFVA
uniref:Gnk2-homologous domain-containing protein n=3 Tax=Triticinae TaxID=1648030 RepID=A0A453AV40_AEGTS